HVNLGFLAVAKLAIDKRQSVLRLAVSGVEGLSLEQHIAGLLKLAHLQIQVSKFRQRESMVRIDPNGILVVLQCGCGVPAQADQDAKLVFSLGEFRIYLQSAL